MEETVREGVVGYLREANPDFVNKVEHGCGIPIGSWSPEQLVELRAQLGLTEEQLGETVRELDAEDLNAQLDAYQFPFGL